jgi:ABC-type Fe3+ transport system permease subunit
VDKTVVSRILIALLVIAGIVGLGVYEYRLGVARGVAMSGKLPGAPPGAYPYPVWGWGFHPFGFVFPLLFLLLIFGLGRRLFWGGWGRPYGWRRNGPPAELDEWHRQAHERMSQQGS